MRRETVAQRDKWLLGQHADLIVEHIQTIERERALAQAPLSPEQESQERIDRVRRIHVAGVPTWRELRTPQQRYVRMREQWIAGIGEWKEEPFR